MVMEVAGKTQSCDQIKTVTSEVTCKVMQVLTLQSDRSPSEGVVECSSMLKAVVV